MPLQLSFVTSAKRYTDLPDTPCEVAFVGRSNVGKSSISNTLRNGGTVVDLPGYGYAKVPGRERASWQGMIEGYLLEREGLEVVFVLVDGEIGPTKLDLQMLDWLRSCDVPHTIVATKLDKVKPSKLATRKKELAKACMLDPTDVLWVSASKGTGIADLQRVIEDLLRT